MAVMMICGPNEDFIFNCVMFLLAIIPSHVHGFYISVTYFNRKRKVRKGVYPGKRKHLIWSDKVNDGGASRREIDRLRSEKEQGRLSRRATRRLTGSVERSSSRKRVQEWDDGLDDYALSPQMSRVSSHGNGRSVRRQRRERDYDSYSHY